MGELPVKVARSLAQAGSGDLMYVDGKGRVIAPARAEARSGAAWGLVIGLSAILLYFAASAGVVGLLPAALFLGWVGRTLIAQRRIRHAAQLVAAGRNDEGRRVLTAVAGMRALPAPHRALTDSYLGAVALREGRFEEALACADRAAARTRRRTIHVVLARYRAVLAATSLGRLDEARRRLAALPDDPGELVRLMRWTCELYLAFTEGRHDLDADALHARARFALGLTTGAALLALLAWAHRQIGHDDMAAHLLAEAAQRDLRDLPRMAPALARWMDENRAPAA
jgi:hypothetical protein